jgi:hypothetical protein
VGTQVFQDVDRVNAGKRARNRCIDVVERGVRKWATDESGRERAAQFDVVNEASASREQIGIFEAENAGVHA